MNQNIKIFYDGINFKKYYNKEFVSGFTINPTLQNNSKNEYNKYKDFAHEYLEYSKNRPISFEIFADDEESIIKEALEINSWNENIYVKIPIINSIGDFNTNIITKLNMMNIKLNITVLMTIKHVNIAFDSIKNKNIPTIFSVFSGRIADTGVNPRNICLFTAELIKNTNIELLWASTREIFNICQAIEYGCHIITIPDDILDKYGNLGKNLDLCCLETVRKFYEDGQKCTIKF